MPWYATGTSTTCPAFEVSSKRRKGFPSETHVKRGLRFVRGGEKELVEKLGREDPCPCGSRKRFQALLPERRPVSTAPSGTIIGVDPADGRRGDERAARGCSSALEVDAGRLARLEYPDSRLDS